MAARFPVKRAAGVLGVNYGIKVHCHRNSLSP